ncbi:MAG: hypothetical protein ACE5NP_06205 [Anaerolineae bacterium]
MFFSLVGSIILLGIGFLLVTWVTERRESGAQPLERSGEGIHLFHERPGGRLVIEVDGERYSTLAEIADPAVRARVVAMLRELAEMVEREERELVAEAADQDLVGVPAPVTADIQPQERTGPEEALAIPEIVPEEFAEPLFTRLAKAIWESLEGVLLFGRWGRAQRATAPEERGEGHGDFVSEIEAILQRLLRESPAGIAREVHVGTDALGSLTITINGDNYRGLDDLPNSRIKELIRAAVREWESQH